MEATNIEVPMQGVSITKQRKDTSQPGQRVRAHSPNIITNVSGENNPI